MGTPDYNSTNVHALVEITFWQVNQKGKEFLLFIESHGHSAIRRCDFTPTLLKRRTGLRVCSFPIGGDSSRVRVSDRSYLVLSITMCFYVQTAS